MSSKARSNTKVTRRQRGHESFPTVGPSPRAYPIWDPATRVIHWLLLLSFVILAITGLAGIAPVLHLWAGYLMLAVLLTRVVWGLIGSDSARLARIVKGPAAIAGYVPLLMSRKPTLWPGHNPIGGLYVIAILALLLAASITGLFFESWAEVRGPLAERVPRAWAVSLSDWHGALIWPMLALVAIHVTVTLGYWLLKGENRIGPIFLSGYASLARNPGLRMTPARLALVVAIAAVSLVLLLNIFGPVA